MSTSPAARLSAALAAAAFVAGPATAQIRFPGTPRGPELPFGGAVPTVEIAALDADALLLEDAMNDAVGPLRFGVPIPLDLDFESAARWVPTPDGTALVGQFRFEAHGAKSIMLEFSRFDLPRGATAFLYDDAMEVVYGAYTSQNGLGGEWSIEPFPGEVATLEVTIPGSVREDWSVVVSDLIYDYRDFFELERGLIPQSGTAGDGGCTIDVNCPAGDPYEIQKRAVVRTVYNGGLCSASLINNELSDGTQYMYTANHCGTGGTVNVRFNYQKPGCNSGTAPTGQSVSGAVLLENDVDTDGRLMRITTPIPPSYGPYYPGWRNNNPNPTFGMSMHHPSGGPKCISIDVNGGGKGTANFIGIGTVKVWFMSFQTGGTLGGSSGSPLFDEDLVIRGTLTGGPSNCQESYYGRLNSFWNDVNLAPYLDPAGTGAEIIGGFDPGSVPPVIDSITPDTVTAFGPGQVTLTGSGFSAVTTLDYGGVELTSPFGFTLVNAGEITFTPPTASGLGSVDVFLSGGAGTSNTVTLDVVETSPPKIAGATFAIGGQPYTWNFGGPLSDIYLLSVSIDDPTTVPILGIDLLLNFIIVDSGFLDGTTGIDSFTATIPSGLNLSTIYSQLITVEGGNQLQDSALISTLIL